jgi:S-adenosylmethionine hydrolase
MLAFLSDFGLQDSYAGELHAVAARLAPSLARMDLSHGVPPGNVLVGAWMLASAWQQLPDECVVCAIVDPDAGSGRKFLVAKQGKRILLCPDNGLASLLRRVVGPDALQIFFASLPNRGEVCAPFEGRDIMVPLACELALGRGEEHLRKTNHAVWLPEAEPIVGRTIHSPNQGPFFEISELNLKIPVLHADRFGNLILDLYRSECSLMNIHIEAPKISIHGISKTYSDVALGGYVAYWGSSGFLEVARRGGSALASLF